MHWNDSCPSIWMQKKMMTALHPLNEEASTLARLYRNPLNPHKIKFLNIIFLDFKA